MDKQKIEELFEPYAELVCSCILDGFERYHQNLITNTDLIDAYGPLQAASCINAIICHNARVRFEGVSGVSISDVPRFLLLVFEEGFNIHFKKLDEGRLAKYNRTTQSVSIARQDPVLPFPDFELEQVQPAEGPWLVAGYQLDPTGREITDILITYPISTTRNAWWLSIYEPQQVESAPLLGPVDHEPPQPIIKPKSRKGIAKNA